MSTKPTANIASGWLDIATFADLDKKLYDGEEVTVLHSKDINPVSFFTRLPVPLKKSGQASGATYTYAKSADFAENTWYTFTTPQIDVVDDQKALYRIAYSPNWGHHVVNSLQLTVNEIPIVKLDPITMDQLSELNLEDADFRAYQRFIGNTNKALTFGDHLPQITVKKPLHELWFGQKTNPVPGNAFPLCCAKHNTIALAVEFVDSLAEVIRIQKNFKVGAGPDDWRDFNPKSVNLADIVTVSGSSGLAMPLPDVWSEYVLVMDDERAMHQAKTIDTVIEQVQRFSSPRVTAGTTRFTFHFSYPLRYLVFSANNVTAADKNYFSNYTTNPLDAATGLDPVRSATLWYDNTARWQNMPGDHFTDLEPLWHAARVPTPGSFHHLEPYCYSTVSAEIDGSSNYSKLATDLEVLISETSTDPADETTDASEYRLELSALVNNLVRFESNSISFPSWSS